MIRPWLANKDILATFRDMGISKYITIDKITNLPRKVEEADAFHCWWRSSDVFAPTLQYNMKNTRQ